MAGVVGTKIPHYSVFGETVEIAGLMEATSDSMKIQVYWILYHEEWSRPDWVPGKNHSHKYGVVVFSNLLDRHGRVYISVQWKRIMNNRALDHITRIP